jgi:hypothetical protein
MDNIQQPTEDGVAASARNHAIYNASRAPQQADRTYDSEWRNYRVWVDDMRNQKLIPPGPLYITRSSVDLYFQEVIVDRDIQPTGARRILSALQWYADRVEYIDGQTKFAAESVSVKQALETHKRLFQVKMGQKLMDPHANLPTNMLTPQESEQAIRSALGQANWNDLTLCWTTCEQSYMRTDSIRKLFLSDLLLDATHGPKEEGIDSFCLAFILRKAIHKERAHRIRVTGVWRHKNFVRCSIGMLAFNLFYRLYHDNQIHFFKSNTAKQPPPWQKTRLIGWETASAAHQAYEALLRRNNLKWQKVTHLRKLGMEHGSARGELNEVELSSLSKHQTGKKITRYETELYLPVMRVMSGHKKSNDDYFVPRTTLIPPNGLTQEDLCRMLFPRIDVWRNQQADF